MRGGMLTLMLGVLISLLSKGSSQIGCFDKLGCRQADFIGMHSTPRECCLLKEEAISFNSGGTAESCQECLVFGWLNETTMVLPQGQEVSLLIGFRKGRPRFRNALEYTFNETELSVIPNQTFFLTFLDIEVTVKALETGSLEDKTTELTLTPLTQFDTSEFLIGTIKIIIPGLEPVVTVDPASVSLTEADQEVMVCLRPRNVAIPDANIVIVAAKTTATIGEDYEVRQTSTFGDPCWTITVYDNFEYEPEEYLYLTWNNISSARLEPAEFVMTIRDNDIAITPEPPKPPPNYVIDTIGGDPMLSVPFNTPSPDFTPGEVALCYEIHGRAGKYFNLISDTCLSVNAHYFKPNHTLRIHVIDQISVVMTNDLGNNINVSVDLEECRVSLGGRVVKFYNDSGVALWSISNTSAIIWASNCESEPVVMWVTCERRTFKDRTLTAESDLIKFTVARGLALNKTSHGLLGQFWNIPITIEPFNSTNRLYTATVNRPSSSLKSRQFVGCLYDFTWHLEEKYCLYVGDRQGAKGSGIHKGPNDPVIEGTYLDYVVDGPFSTDFGFSQFGKI